MGEDLEGVGKGERVKSKYIVLKKLNKFIDKCGCEKVSINQRSSGKQQTFPGKDRKEGVARASHGVGKQTNTYITCSCVILSEMLARKL